MVNITDPRCCQERQCRAWFMMRRHREARLAAFCSEILVVTPTLSSTPERQEAPHLSAHIWQRQQTLQGWGPSGGIWITLVLRAPR